MSPLELHKRALAEAQAAGDAELAKWRATGREPNYCGFAWAVIKPARGAFVKALKDAGIARPGTYGGVEISVWLDFPGPLTQSMDLKEAGVARYCEVLRENGINAWMRARAD